MSELREYLQKRMATLEPLEKELLAKLAPIQSELEEARRALHSVQSRAPVGRRRGKTGPSATSIQGQILSILKSTPSGLKAVEILERARVDFGRQIRRESLAPQLSRLCADSYIENNAGVYRMSPTPADDTARERKSDGV
jgi:hypothetical protein